MPQRQLNIRSDEAAEKATRLAKQLGKTTTEIVVEALRSYEERSAPRGPQGRSPEHQRRFEALQSLSARTAKHLIPGSPEGHDWLYDEDGLPK